MRAPSFVAECWTSKALPLLRWTTPYQALVSTVAADTGAALNAVTSPPSSTATAAARPAARRLRPRGTETGGWWPDPDMGVLLIVEVGQIRGTGNVRTTACAEWSSRAPSERKAI